MNRSYLIAGLILLAAIAWVATGRFVSSERADAGAPPAAEAPAEAKPGSGALPQVRVARLAAQPMVAEVVLQGHTSAARTVELRNEVRGRIEEVLAGRGSPVKAGDPIVRLAVEDRETLLQQARALLAQRQAELDAARVLAGKGFNSDIRLSEAKALQDAAQAAVRRAEIELANTVIRAPFDGVLNQRPVEVGDFLDIGKPVAIVVDLDPVKVVGFVSERDVGQLRLGGTGVARLVGAVECRGRISYISAAADPQTRTFRVELEVPNPDHRIADGLTAQLRLPVAERPAHKVSPAVLTLADDGAVGVKLVGEDNRVSFHPVQILGSAPDGVWLGGLPERVTLITVGQDYVVAGQEVRPVEMTAAGGKA